MKARNILAVLLLMVACMETAWAQYGMQLWSNGKLCGLYYLNDVDSIRFIDYMEVWYKDGCPWYNVSAIDSVKFANVCPDNNHPHAIDLGLPSGTKWCCCNVGASKPEESGAYYAWGETWEKELYTMDTYTYYDNDKKEYINIGFDIAGTSYDAAYVQMGSPWRMPSFMQMEELINNCSFYWLNSQYPYRIVNGMVVIGPNGSQIFLPAVGACGGYDGRCHDYGVYGCYSTSSRHRDYESYANRMDFNSYGRSLSSYWREAGCSVRAVCP